MRLETDPGEEDMPHGPIALEGQQGKDRSGAGIIQERPDQFRLVLLTKGLALNGKDIVKIRIGCCSYIHGIGSGSSQVFVWQVNV